MNPELIHRLAKLDEAAAAMSYATDLVYQYKEVAAHLARENKQLAAKVLELTPKKFAEPGPNDVVSTVVGPDPYRPPVTKLL